MYDGIRLLYRHTRLVVGTEAFWVVTLSNHHQKASFKPWREVYLAPGPENCPCRANPTCQICANTTRAGFSVGVSRRCRVDERKVALRSSMTCHTPLPNFAQLLGRRQFCGPRTLLPSAIWGPHVGVSRSLAACDWRARLVFLAKHLMEHRCGVSDVPH